MLKVVLFIATSHDGCIASFNGTLDWLFHDADNGYTEFLVSLDAVMMGRADHLRHTFATMLTTAGVSPRVA